VATTASAIVLSDDEYDTKTSMLPFAWTVTVSRLGGA